MVKESSCPRWVEKAMAPHSSTLAWETMDGGAWWATDRVVAESRTQLIEPSHQFSRLNLA